MNILSIQSTKTPSIKTIWFLCVLCSLFLNSLTLSAQSEFDKASRDKSYKKGSNSEYYKNGSLKLTSEFKRKVFWYYTDTYWTIKEYDMEGNLVRMTKKVTQTARRENREVIIKEEVFNYEPKKPNEPKETIRPDENQ